MFSAPPGMQYQWDTPAHEQKVAEMFTALRAARDAMNQVGHTVGMFLLQHGDQRGAGLALAAGEAAVLFECLDRYRKQLRLTSCPPSPRPSAEAPPARQQKSGEGDPAHRHPASGSSSGA